MDYAAFISYSHDADNAVASALQSGLHSFAKPWHRRRVIHVFRDKSNLSVNPALWASIQQALDAARYFVLLASPTSAESTWVQKEIQYWVEHKSAGTLLIVLTAGEIVWDGGVKDFDWRRTTSLPTLLQRTFDDVPHYLDLRWLKREEHLSLREPRFRDAIAEIAATLRGVSKDDLVGEDVHQHKKTKRLVCFAVAALTILTIASLVFALLAVQQSALAKRRAQIALARQLIAESELLRNRDEEALELSVLLALEAMNRLSVTGLAESAADRVLRRGLALLPRLVSEYPLMAEYPVDEPFRGTLTFLQSGDAVAAIPSEPKREHLDIRRVADGTMLMQIPLERGVSWSRFSQDGARLTVMVQEDDQTIRTWSIGDSQQVASLNTKDHKVAGANADGRLVVTEMRDFRCRIWDAGRQVVLATLASSCNYATFSSDNDTLLTTDGSRADVWDVRSGRRVFGTAFEAGMQGWTYDLSSSGRLFAVGFEDGTVQVWDVRAARPVLRVRHGNWAGIVTISPREKYLVTASGSVEDAPSSDNTARVWSLETHEEVARLRQGQPVGDLVFSADEEYVATVGGEVAHVWKTKTGAEVARVVHSTPVLAMDLDESGKRLVTLSTDGRARVWEVYHATATVSVSHSGIVRPGAWQGIDELEFGTDGSYFLTQSDSDNTVRVWQSATGEQIGSLPRGERFLAASLIPKQAFVATANERVSEAHIWAIPAGRMAAKVAMGSPPFGAAFSVDGRYLAATTKDGLVCVWETMSWEPIARFEHGSRVLVLAFSSDGTQLVTGGDGGTIRIWPTAGGEEIRQLTVGVTVSFLAFSPDGRRLAARGDQIYLWTVLDFNKAPLRLSDAFSNLAFSPSGDRVAVTCDRQQVCVFDMTNGREVVRLQHEGAGAFAFSPGGSFLAAAGDTKGDTVIVWSVARRDEVARVNHGSFVTKVQFSPDGRFLATSGPEDLSAYLWSWQSKDLVSIACSRLTRDLEKSEWSRFVRDDDKDHRRVCPELSRRSRNTRQ